MTMGDRIMVLRAGRIQQVGKPEELYNDPANVFVGGFIGSPAMNLLPGQLDSNGNGLSLVTRSGTLPLPPQVGARLRTNGGGAGPREVIWGIRAEDVRLGPGDAAGNHCLRGAVDLVEGLGSDAHVSLTLGKDSLVVRTPADERPAEGENVSVFINANKVHLFDAKTEETLSER
jgi:multiple sugar transport system ATP-binding protein